MRRRKIAALVVTLIALSMAGCVSFGRLLPTEMERVTVQDSERWLEPYRIALIDVDGFIGIENSWLLTGTTLADLKEKLSRAADDWRVQAVVLRINSAGGAASASDAMYRQVKRFKKETGKPVVACLMGTAASGAYYTALGADHIIASPTAVTGSVGVIMHFTDVQGLYNKLGLESRAIKSGEKKDMGSPVREMTPEERRIMENILKSLFTRFLEAVRTEREDMTEEDISTIADGRVIDAQRALELHLVDELGYLEDAIAKARELADIGGAHVVMYRAWPHYNTNIYSRSSAAAPQPNVLTQGLRAFLRQRGPVFLYMWWPGQ